jgi:hypothetical protein
MVCHLKFKSLFMIVSSGIINCNNPRHADSFEKFLKPVFYDFYELAINTQTNIL